MGRKCVGVTVCALLLLLVHSTEGSGSGSSESADVTSTEYLNGQTTDRYDSEPVVAVIPAAEDKISPKVSSPDAIHRNLDASKTGE